jgi:ABC-2 type transport system permease protein
VCRSQLLALWRNELAKALRRKLPYWGFFGVALLCVIVYFIADQLIKGQTANAWGYTAFSMQLIFNDIGLIFILVFSAMLIAEEMGTGTIRAVLSGPLYRWELYLAKAATGVLYMLALSLVALAASMALAGFHYRFGAAGDAYGVVYSRGTILRNFLLAYALSWLPLGALAMYGLFISTLVRSSGAAVAVSISSIYVVDFTKHLVGLEPYIFTRNIGYPWQILQQVSQGVDFQWRPEVWNVLGLSGGCALVFFCAGLLVFVRRDLNH